MFSPLPAFYVMGLSQVYFVFQAQQSGHSAVGIQFTRGLAALVILLLQGVDHVGTSICVLQFNTEGIGVGNADQGRKSGCNYRP